jgi:hypothetical protein
MQDIQPRTLSNTELINMAAHQIAKVNGMPLDWQYELLRRFTALAPHDEFPPIDPAQLDLFK